MPINSTDISLVLSGGTANTDINLSLGGPPSGFAVFDDLNNLFADVTNDEAVAGRVDYRCFYAFNDHGTDTLYTVNVWVASQVDGGADVTFGLSKQNDIQVVTVAGGVTGGTLTLSLNGDQATTTYGSTLVAWGLNLQSVLNGLPHVRGAVVFANEYYGIVTFQIQFQGVDANRYFPQIVVAANNLIGPSGTPIVTVTKLLDGSPINAIAPQIDLDTSEPPGITFVASSQTAVIGVGDLKPTEGFPVWVKRTVLPGAIPRAADGFAFSIDGDPIQ